MRIKTGRKPWGPDALVLKTLIGSGDFVDTSGGGGSSVFVSGTGTVNYIPRFIGSSTIANSHIIDALTAGATLNGGGASCVLTLPNVTGTVALGTGAIDTLTKWAGTNALTNIANAVGFLYNSGAGAFSFVASGPGLLGNGTMQYQVPVTGATPFTPVWSGFLLDGTAGGKTVFAVTNAKTLTLTSVDDYNITIPATGTVALGTGAASTLAYWSTVNTLTNLANSGAISYLRNDGAGALSWQAGAPVLGTPGTLTVSTANVAADPHTHAVTSVSSSTAAANLLSCDAAGGLQLITAGFGVAPVANQIATVMSATTTNAALVLQTSDNNITKYLFEAKTSGGVTLAAIGATGIAYFSRGTALSNVFLSGAGNTTASSGSNFAYGEGSLGALTSGENNYAGGCYALGLLTTQSNNIALGISAMYNCAAGANVGIGNYVMFNATAGIYNVAIGFNAGKGQPGLYAGQENTFVGAFSGFNCQSSNNTLIGMRAGYSGAHTGNTYVGDYAGYTGTSNIYGVLIGNFAGFYETGSYKLFIDNAPRANEADGRIKALIYGIFDAHPADQRFTVNGILGASIESALTNTIQQIAKFSHNTTGTAAAGFGTSIDWYLQSSTTADQAAAKMSVLWYEAAHATRKADLVISAFDTLEREGLRIRATGSAAQVIVDSLTASTVVYSDASKVLTSLANSGSVSYLRNDGAGALSWVTGAAPISHNVLDSTYHGDVLTGAIARGELLVGNATPKIDRLAKGAQYTVLSMGADDPAWVTVQSLTSGMNYYLWDVASDVAGFDRLNRTPPTEVQQNDWADCIGAGGGTFGAEVIVESYMTDAGDPSALTIPAGSWMFHFYSYVDQNIGTNRLVWKVYSCSAAGASEVLVFSKTATTNTTSINVAAPTEILNEYYSTVAHAFVSNTDRLILKMYVQTSSNNTRRIHFLHSGNVFTSHFSTPLISGVGLHNFLSATHPDVTVAACARGAIISGQGASAKWTSLALSAPAATFMNYLGAANGDTEPGYKVLFDATVPSTIAESAAAAAGTATVAARRDHTHGAPATWKPTDHAHSSADGTTKLTQANSHQSPDTDAGAASLHHTIGAGAAQAAAGNHTHTQATTFTLTAAPSDHASSGIIIPLVAHENQAFGDVCYIAADGQAQLVDADAIATSSGIVMALAGIDIGQTGNYLMYGVARDDTWNWTVGGLIFITVTGTSANTLSQTAPTGANDVVQIVGVATHADRMIFFGNLVQVEHV